jgi:GNAT superfamily N-acetyltransferase
LAAFFAALPPSDRHFMKDDVTNPETTREWATNQDRSRWLALVAADDGRIVADAVLLRHRGPARQHQAEVRVNILPEFQGRGLGTKIIRELAERAWAADAEMLEFEQVEGVQTAAIEAVRGIGAYLTATQAGYLRDVDDEARDLAHYVLPLSARFRF